MADVIRFGDERVPERFWQRVEVAPSECWEWRGSVEASGYGMVSLTQALRAETGLRRTERAHRLFYRLLVGPLPSGKAQQLDHLCRNRACCNPDHLELVVARVNNVVRSVGPAGQNSRKSACHRGHDLTDPQNVIVRVRNGHENRRCAICRQIDAARDNQRAAERRAAALAAL